LAPPLLVWHPSCQLAVSPLLIRRRPSSTPFPYTTLFRSGAELAPSHRWSAAGAQGHGVGKVEISHCHTRDLMPVMSGHQRSNQSDRKSTRLNSSHVKISYAVFCLKKKRQEIT